MEVVAAGEIGDAARKTAAVAHAHDVFAAARGGFRRPLRTADNAVAARRLPGACRPLHLYGLRKGCSAGMPSTLAAESVPVCASSGHYFLLSSAAGRGGPSHPERTSEAEILRSRHGFGNVVRPGGKFPVVPGADSGGVREDGGHGQLRGAGRNVA